MPSHAAFDTVGHAVPTKSSKARESASGVVPYVANHALSGPSTSRDCALFARVHEGDDLKAAHLSVVTEAEPSEYDYVVSVAMLVPAGVCTVKAVVVVTVSADSATWASATAVMA